MDKAQFFLDHVQGFFWFLSHDPLKYFEAVHAKAENMYDLRAEVMRKPSSRDPRLNNNQDDAYRVNNLLVYMSSLLTSIEATNKKNVETRALIKEWVRRGETEIPRKERLERDRGNDALLDNMDLSPKGDRSNARSSADSRKRSGTWSEVRGASKRR